LSGIFTQLSHPCLDVAVRAAESAGSILRNSFRKKVAVQSKDIANFVSEVDLKAEAAIGGILREAFPDHEILGEEGVNSSAFSDHLWVVDPLDGTSNYLHGIPHFAVSLGYIVNGRHELGVIYNPMTEDWFAVVRGQGSWYNGAPMSVGDETQLSEVIVAVGFYYDRGRLMEKTLDAIAALFRCNIHGIRRFGAATLDLAQVARGDYGAFMEFKLQPWDHAAGALMVREAGGRVEDCQGNPLPIRSQASMLATNGKIHDQMLAITTKHFSELS
jgi:myo-inositol-1(or 4)-monophosphatase